MYYSLYDEYGRLRGWCSEDNPKWTRVVMMPFAFGPPRPVQLVEQEEFSILVDLREIDGILAKA
jgi:hypothetical protein